MRRGRGQRSHGGGGAHDEGDRRRRRQGGAGRVCPPRPRATGNAYLLAQRRDLRHAARRPRRLRADHAKVLADEADRPHEGIPGRSDAGRRRGQPLAGILEQRRKRGEALRLGVEVVRPLLDMPQVGRRAPGPAGRLHVTQQRGDRRTHMPLPSDAWVGRRHIHVGRHRQSVRIGHTRLPDDRARHVHRCVRSSVRSSVREMKGPTDV